MSDLVIVGAGRVGLTFARALRHAGHHVRVLGRAERPLPDGVLKVESLWAEALSQARLIVVSVPDDAIASVAERLAAEGIKPEQVVLHTSGLQDRTALAALDSSGAALGSIHPMQSFPDRSGNPERLHGISAAIEGDSRALGEARWLARRLGFSPVIEITAEGKPRYHAAAVFACNYVVVLAAIAQRLAGEAGIPESQARALLAPIMTETVAQLAERSPRSVLTGPVARGDQGTIAAHLDILDGRVKQLYELLAQEAALLVTARTG